MKIIGAGFPRTGTMSMQAALNHLGYPCYHMEIVARNVSHLQAWDDFFTGCAAMDWQTLFQNYEATVDAPACFYYEELMHMYPDAKVILMVRDSERWYASFMTLVRTIQFLRTVGYVVPPLGRFLNFVTRLHDRYMVEPEIQDKAQVIEAFNQHNEVVQRLVPKERLLVFHVKDGWEPLCAFLGCEVPQDTPFPHLNAGDATVKAKLHEIFMTGPFRGIAQRFRRSSNE
ncbi:MAG: sulfotransferase family protein [Chloroflexota bacterium]